MLKVYCDTGAYRPELSTLEAQGKLIVCQFKYENKNRRIKHKAPPSEPSWEELNYTWQELDDLSWLDMGRTSQKWQSIKVLLGPNNLRDAKHLDSAFMEGCSVFFTSDKGDIVSRRDEIWTLLGLEVLHFRDDWDEFVSRL
jgi:hypothetical protein